jgi:gliding motility-associated-like protein
MVTFVYFGYSQDGNPNEITTLIIRPGEQPVLKKSTLPGDIAASRKPAARRTGNLRTASFTLNIITTGSTCNRGDGVITVTASGGTPPYSYDINGWGPRPIGYFAGLGAQSYSLTVEDATGAVVSQVVTITNSLDQPTVRIAGSTSPTCPRSNDGTITLAATGGTPPYTYSMDAVNYQASNVFTNLTPGMYSFYVMDANGCRNVYSDFYGSAVCGFGYALAFSQTVCGNSGFINVIAHNATAPYTYSLDGINYVPVGSFTGLSAGIHPIYAKDATGKVGIYSIVMYNYCPPLVAISSAACNMNDGTITITAREGMSPFTYSLDGVNFQASNVFTGLTSGYYYATVKDAVGQTKFVNVFVDNNCPLVSATVVDEVCGLGNGRITATGTKGTPPYQYSIDGTNFQSSNIFNGVSAGDYTVTIKDVNGYIGTTSVTVKNNCLTLTAVPQHVVCGNRNGKITVTGSGGTAPYQYSINGFIFQSLNEFTGLSAGPYTITIRDATNATSTTTVEIEDSPGPVFTASSFPASCANNDGFITVNATGGTDPLEYSLDGLNFQSSNQFLNLLPGQYRVTVRDDNGCIAFQTIPVNFYCLSVTAAGTEDVCGNSNATITLNAANGIPPYEYSIDGINYQSNNTFAGIAAGNYTVYARDANGTVRSNTVAVIARCVSITAIAENEICGNKNGRIVATGSNGASPYKYSLDGTNFQAGNTFEQLQAGTYTVTVMDATGLSNTTSVEVRFTRGPQLIVVPTPASCLDNDGSAVITGSGGTSPLVYSVGGNPFLNSPVFNNLKSGFHTALVRDANGCTAKLDFTVQLTNNLHVDAGADKTICEGVNTELAAISNGQSFSWTPVNSLSQTSGKNTVASPVVTTKYFVTATLGPCTKQDSVSIFVNPAPAAVAGSALTICYGQSVTLQGSGGVSCAWSPSTYLDDTRSCNPVVRKPTNNITYQLTVTDALGCSSVQPAAVTVHVTPPVKVFAGNDTAIAANQPFRLNAIDINNSGIASYTWSPAAGLSDAFVKDPIVMIDRPVTYSVTATTAAGCEGSDNIYIKVYPGPEIYVPNAFSPNGDAYNGVLRAIPVGIKEFRFFAVYNRWGQRVFYTTNPGAGWDGRVGSHSQNTNTFAWKAAGVDGNGNLVERSGVVMVVR